MTKEHAYTYEAGYRDGSIHYELEHCPACKNVADLQEALEENAKLRERAVAMLSELRGVVSEGDYDSPSGRYFLLRRDVAAYEDALRELGVEVDE